MNVAQGDVRKNTQTAEELITDAAKRGSHLVMLPELWSTGYALNQAKDLASPLNVGIFAQLATWSTQNKISIVGSVMEKRGLEVANSSAFYAPNGKMIGVYRKIHLFRLMEEDRYLQPGSAPLMMDLPWGPTGMAICYDLRFPELFRKYAVQGAKLILLVSAWPIERIEHWRALLIARAIENQCYMAAVNAVGQTGNAVFGGHSMIVDPWGKVVIEVGESPTLATADIDLDQVDRIRAKIPVFEDRRPETY
ncbi:MAG: carbon-nitrogen family hydrolase [Anaerolineae bacterium]|nr:carbon-nitrogen family hydrolase [Chloroflexota bacterium]MBK9747301.1 carbon-nitrogen family hydrolase [Chloroflexota bacterium]MBN8634522.1 carbon-nitrogen family hydrolase [Anaerolineae bacterium]